MTEFSSEREIILRSTYSPPPENRAVYEIIWKNMVGPDRPNMETQQGAKKKKYAICTPGNKGKNTGTNSEYVILVAFPLQHWLHERATVLRYTYTACLVRAIFTSCILFFSAKGVEIRPKHEGKY